MIWLLVLLMASPQPQQVKEVTDQAGKIHRVFSQNGEIYYQVWLNDTFTTPINLSNSPKDKSFEPQIDIKGEIITVQWKEEHKGKTYTMRTNRLLSFPKWKLPIIIGTSP